MSEELFKRIHVHNIHAYTIPAQHEKHVYRNECRQCNAIFFRRWPRKYRHCSKECRKVAKEIKKYCKLQILKAH